jgi:hypothetical protein
MFPRKPLNKGVDFTRVQATALPLFFKGNDAVHSGIK